MINVLSMIGAGLNEKEGTLDSSTKAETSIKATKKVETNELVNKEEIETKKDENILTEEIEATKLDLDKVEDEIEDEEIIEDEDEIEDEVEDDDTEDTKVDTESTKVEEKNIEDDPFFFSQKSSSSNKGNKGGKGSKTKENKSNSSTKSTKKAEAKKTVYDFSEVPLDVVFQGRTIVTLTEREETKDETEIDYIASRLFANGYTEVKQKNYILEEDPTQAHPRRYYLKQVKEPAHFKKG